VSEEGRQFSIRRLTHLWRDYDAGISAAVTGVLVLVCYGFVLRLPLFFDDLPILTWLSDHNWGEIWTSSESAYYRPLTFVIYKFGQSFAPGVRQVVLHAVNLIVLWLNSLLLTKVTRMYGRSSIQALLAGTLLVVFPFAYLAIPWVTALGHPLVTFLTLLAVYAALRAERGGRLAWWGLSLAASALAPFAHESGPVCSLIVGGAVLVQEGLRTGRRRVLNVPVGVVIGLMLNAGAVILRDFIPGIGSARPLSPECWLLNTTYFLHGLTYPLGPVIGWLVKTFGWQDLALVQTFAVLFLVLVAWLGARTRDWRWIAISLWWWACGAAPAIVALEFNYLYISPRLYILSSVGTVMLWSWVLVELAKLLRSGWRRWLLGGVLAGAIIAQNVDFLDRQRALFGSLNHVYQQVLEAAIPEENAPLGFVNLPAALALQNKTYALILENVIFIPWYSNVGEFIEVNLGWRASDGVIFTPVRTDTEDVFGAQGQGLDWEAMRQFAVDHRTVWLVRYKDGKYLLEEVGTISRDCEAAGQDPFVRFEGGPEIESASVREVREGTWAVTLEWRPSGPIEGEVFVHVRDAENNVVAQADGPALGGMVPVWLWQAGDCITDIRIIDLPPGNGPFQVQVGVYNAAGRFPAYISGVRASEDAASVAVIDP